MANRSAHLNSALENAAALVAKDPAQAEDRLKQLLEIYPARPDILTLLAAARRRQGRPAAAIELIEPLVIEYPQYPLAHQELGLARLESGQIEAAESSLAKAVELAPDLPLAWKSLGDLRAARGDREGSESAYQNHTIAVVGAPELIEAARLLTAGKLGQAEKLCRRYLMDHPTNPSAIRLLAEVGLKLGRLEDAEKLLLRCLELAPDFHLARSNYANLLSRKLRHIEALAQIDQVLSVDRDNPSYLLLKASILVRIGDNEGAIELYRQVLDDYPRQPRTLMSLGHALKTVGRQDEAIDAYRASIALQPGLGEAYWSLANLKTFRFEDRELTSLIDQARLKHTTPEDYFNLFFALGKAHEDRADYDLAFANYQKGNAIRRRTVRWDADEHHTASNGLSKFFTPEFFEERLGWGCPDRSPIFIVGLPRSGSTLLEQILASHSQVEGTMELPDILSIARRLSGKKSRDEISNYPAVLGELTAAEAAALGEEYLQRTAIHRSGTPRFIDKMPNNFTHAGLIHLILPNASIIDARRHPLACCFSGYKQLFASGQNFTYDLTDIGRYYRDYVMLMNHWDRVLPGRVFRMNYEDVVADIEVQVRGLLDYCGLTFEPDCLEFHRTERAVRTASSEQVRQPLYTEAVEQWIHFEPYLAPLFEALGPDLAN